MTPETAQTGSGRYAIVAHGGSQFRVEVGDVLTVDRVDAEIGAQVDFGKALLVQDGSDVKIGRPEVAGANVKATVLAHERGAKILVFKFKKTKNYRRKRGHRQELSRLRIDSISL